MVTKIALIFPGQGVQKVGMGKELYEGSVPAKSVLDLADKVCGNGLLKVMFEGPEEQLTKTAYAQPAILSMSLAALAAFKAHARFSSVEVCYTAGLSLGEYSALAAAGVMTLEDTLRLVLKRGTCMDEACLLNKGTMAAVLGFDKDKLVQICSQTGAEVANFNSNEQIVITGHADKVAAAIEAIKSAGGQKVIPLAVSGAFHSSLMQSAADKFKAALQGVSISIGGIKVITNVNAKPQHTADEVRQNLYRQITASVQWVATIQFLRQQGITHFVEVGPGKVLKGLIRRIDPDAVVQNIEKPADIEALVF